jgi:hypothetical protein
MKRLNDEPTLADRAEERAELAAQAGDLVLAAAGHQRPLSSQLANNTLPRPQEEDDGTTAALRGVQSSLGELVA